MDKKIKRMMNKELKIKRLPIECHHASWRRGRLFYPNLQERGDVLAIRSFAQMTPSHDDCVPAAMRQFIEDERIFRKWRQTPMHNSLTEKREEAQVQGHQISLKRREKHARTRIWSS
jgi:hypothetical protein